MTVIIIVIVSCKDDLKDVVKNLIEENFLCLVVIENNYNENKTEKDYRENWQIDQSLIF